MKLRLTNPKVPSPKRVLGKWAEPNSLILLGTSRFLSESQNRAFSVGARALAASFELHKKNIRVSLDSLLLSYSTQNRTRKCSYT